MGSAILTTPRQPAQQGAHQVHQATKIVKTKDARVLDMLWILLKCFEDILGIGCNTVVEDGG